MILITINFFSLLLEVANSNLLSFCSNDSKCSNNCNALSNCCSFCKCQDLIKYQKSFITYGCDKNKCEKSSNKVCQECSDGYYLKDQICYSCVNPCEECQSESICTKCKSKYKLENNKCIKSSSIALCEEVEWFGTKCKNCVDHASLHDNNSKCECNDGYIQDDDECRECLTTCNGCENYYYYCKTCQNDSYMKPIDNGKCICQDSYFWDGSKCQECSKECLKCENDKNNCIDCIPTLELNEKSQCICQQGTSPSINVFPFDCLQCSSNCLYCKSDANYCTQCYQNYILNTSLNKCECPSGFFETNFECQSCQINCVLCNSLNDCQKCQEGYYYDNNISSCSKCIDQCLTCSSKSVCLSCDLKQQRSLNQNQCPCNTGFFENPNFLCQKCTREESIAGNCKYTDCSDGVWTYGEQCDDGNQINRDGCQNCQIQESFYCINTILQLSKCFRCFENCLKCKYNQRIMQVECLNAESGYFISELKVSKCSDKCLECQNHPTQCLVCRFLNIGKDKLDCQLCEYKDGYYSNFEEQKCFTKCGDSIKADIEECDDGNLENGDGCDRFCKLEKSFNCQNGICNKLQLPQPLGFENQIFDLYTPQRQVIVYYQQLLNLTNSFQIEDIINVDLATMEDNVRFTYSIESNLDFQQVNQFNLSYVIDIFVNQSISNASVQVTYLEPQKIRNVDNQEQIIIQIYIPITKVIVISSAAKELTQNSVSSTNYLIYMLIGLLATGVLLGGLDIYFNLIDTIQQISYLYYINTIFPFNVNQFFENLNFAQFTFVQDFINLDEIVNFDLGYDLEIHSLTVPFKIKNQGFYSCFLLNFASIFSVFAIGFCIFISAQLIYSKLQSFQQNDQKQIKVSQYQEVQFQILLFFSKIKQNLLKWSISVLREYFYSDILRVFMTVANEYCFVVNLGLKGLDFQNYFGIINSNLTFISFGIYIIIVYYSFTVVNLKPYAVKTKLYQQKYGSFIEGMVISKYSKYFNPILLIKKFFFMLFLVQLYDCPLIQLSSILILNMATVFFMGTYIPFIDRLELKKQLICEISQTLTMILFSVFCINDQLNFLNDFQKLNLGWLVIANVLMTLVTQVIINTLQQWKVLYKKYNFIKQIAKKFEEIRKKCNSKENPSIQVFI